MRVSGIVTFNDKATAGSATINNNNSGTLIFNNRSSADNATIVNNADGLFGGIAFNNHSTAGNAFITTNNGALTLFLDHSDGGNSALRNGIGRHIVDFSSTIGLNGDRKITAGSIAGAGDYIIGAAIS